MNKKKLSLLIIGAAVVIAIAAVFVLQSDLFTSNEKKQVVNTSTTTVAGSVGTTSSTSSPNTQSPSPKKISVTLTTPINNDEYSGRPVTVRAILDGATQGTCTVIFSKKGEKDVTATAPIIQAPTYYTCEGFDIEESKFPSKGQWNVKVSVESSDARGESEQRKITVS